MFHQTWFYTLLFSVPLASSIAYGGRKAGNDFFKILGIILIAVNVLFAAQTIFVADCWWYGLIAYVFGFVLQVVYAFVRPFLMILMPSMWSLIEIAGGIILPILSHMYLYK